MEFQTSDEEAAYRERFDRQAQNADPVSKARFEAWYGAGWEDARGYFDRPGEERRYMPRGPVDQAPAEIAEAFMAWEKYVEVDGVIPTRLSIFEAGRAAGMGTLERFRREFPAPTSTEETTQAEEKPELQLVESMSLDEAVGVALGYASACWSNLNGAGVFESDRAAQASRELVRYISEAYKAWQGRDAKPEETEVTESGLSEFGRGYEAGEASANDRALRTVALGHAVDLAKMGDIKLRDGNGATISFGDPLAVAQAYYEFLAGGKG